MSRDEPNDGSEVLIGKGALYRRYTHVANRNMVWQTPRSSMSSDDPSEWKSVEDAWIAGYFAYGYADDLLPVKAIDPERKTVTAAQATL